MLPKFKLFPSPYSGILFLYVALTNEQVSKILSVPLFGDSFFMMSEDEVTQRLMKDFPSPYSGILFL